MRTVVISFDPADPSKVGSTQELPDDKARQLVAAGRARYTDKPAEDNPSGTSDTPTPAEEPTPAEDQPEASAPPPSGRKPKAAS